MKKRMCNSFFHIFLGVSGEGYSNAPRAQPRRNPRRHGLRLGERSSLQKTHRRSCGAAEPIKTFSGLRWTGAGLQTKQISNCSFHGFQVRGIQLAKFSKKRVLIDAGQALDVHCGRLWQPFGFSEVHLAAQSADLRCQRGDDHERPRVLRLGKCQDDDRPLFCCGSKIDGPDLAGMRFNIRQGLYPRFFPDRRLGSTDRGLW